MLRLFLWKFIRLFRLQHIEYGLWGNRKIFLDHDSFQCMWIMYNYIVDWKEFNLIRDYLRPADQVADIGSNMGYYTIWMSKFIQSGCIHAFEPDSRNFERLTENCKLNRLHQVALNRTALSDREVEVFFTTGLDGENHMLHASDENTITVPSTTFDKYCLDNNISKIAYTKVDIEGFELFFLKGAQVLLARKAIDILQIEINENMRHAGVTIEDLLNYIQQTPYRLCSYDPGKKRIFPTGYSPGEENYLLVADTEAINDRIRENMAAGSIRP